MARKTKVVHVAKTAAELDLAAKFEYLWLPLAYDFFRDEQETELFSNGQLNPKLFDIIFVIDNHATLLRNQPEALKQLPAHRLIYAQEAALLPETKRLLALKEALPLDLKDHGALGTFINEHYLPKQEGYKLQGAHVKVNPRYKKQVVRQGNSYFEISGPFTEEPRQVLTWKMTTMAPEGERINFYPEFQSLEGDLEVTFKIFLIHDVTGEVSEILEYQMADFAEGAVVFKSPRGSSYINLSVYVKGNEGTIRVGSQHFRKALRKGHVMIPGGHNIYDRTQLNGELIHYFDPGDLKPPLAIYFSGYRSAEGFEGRRMMASMGCPYMLIGDPRLEGGNFYMGGEELEQQLVAIIKEKLELLGFDRHQVILSGLSMGTYGALYYAADLEPHCIIVGKPLVNIGTVALNEKIQRPEAFGTSLDMLYHTMGELSEEAAAKMNQRFWQKFVKGNYHDTTFALSYMKQDDYDMQAFPMLFKALKEKDPVTRILYKGVVGRHNDNSPAINTWFLKQYRNVMVNSFQRTPSEFK